MKVTKTVTTRYHVDLINAKPTAMAVSDAILALENADVNIQDGRIQMGGYNDFTLVVEKTTYYDDSTLDRMENG